MHLLAATPGTITDGSEAVDLGQSPGDIVFLSAADTELSSLAVARRDLEGFDVSLRLANNMQLAHNLSVDIYVEEIISQARLVVIRLLGGVNYWPYGVEQITECCRRNGIKLAFLPGDDQPDEELTGLNTLPREDSHRLWQYLVEGGAENYRQALKYCHFLISGPANWQEPRPLLKAGLYWPGLTTPGLDLIRDRWQPDGAVCAIVFYRALYQANNLAPVDDLISALADRGLNPLPLYVTSLKDPVSAGIVTELLTETTPSVILNATGFAVSSPSGQRKETPFDGADCPVLQVIFSGGNEDGWRNGIRGLSARDIAMNVALPEVDGRVLSRAVSFKADAGFDGETETSIVAYKSVPDRIRFVAALAANWARLRNTPAEDRAIALVLANYPNKNGRIGNGVGLDTPAGTIEVMTALAKAGYDISGIPETGNDLIDRLLSGPTNDRNEGKSRISDIRLSLPDYLKAFEALPPSVREQVSARWGDPERDPFFHEGAFHLSLISFGKVIVGIQPARGYNIDPVSSYHDPDLVPPHGYFAFYIWLTTLQKVGAIVHMGKHGNMEWLPGKSLALSETCFPEAVFGPTPHIYPFIVNDPGEGTQAKRRAAAVIIDHLTPPMTRAESYGPLADLERLVDEYYEAAGVDPRRIRLLRQQILELTQISGVDIDCGISANDEEEEQLSKLDNYLCELKELQIRDGLHVFGQAPAGRLLVDLLVALVRIPRNDGKGKDASLIRALAEDLALGSEFEFDPLDCRLGDPWAGPQPAALNNDAGRWRTNGDTVERLEELAADLVSGARQAQPEWKQTQAVLDGIDNHLRPVVEQCGRAEINGLLTGLAGRFVAPGPSGAPTRGRNDVLPTGRNFFSVDSRAVPTPTAWTLGWKSADMLIRHYRQQHGEWPKSMILSAWGTANMRTGGDDIAQALALMGVRPKWDTASNRVVGFEILPASIMDRPRVDVTLRVSGFFRDAFPQQMALFDSAARAVAKLDEDPATNPLAARVAEDTTLLLQDGLDQAEAERRASYRLFGSKPGAYGAGLQALIDEKGWSDEGDLARAYIAWGGYAYGAGADGKAAHDVFTRRLGRIDAVVHNQDNREHDLLDSDDYYQFEGGVTAAIRHVTGSQPSVYHNDHSRPESPKIRTLEAEIGRVVRARAANPKWIEGVMRHGYKGAFEMSATVDYLFAFAATAHAVKDHHFEALFDAYIGDETVRDFIRDNNPDALQDMIDRFQEAIERGLWSPRRNSLYGQIEALKAETAHG
ncbi:cobaltochelatase subunit CobN [Sneathiella chinensis]|uniref:Cobaltochelatase subunit CobN n=1 Tax=Sneathiella chinensis TaxID=349750 RepID=A0ABQ5U6R2_9PROT|nr:cobaltochelatase subunit CobN [Sneathiella chinensis]GLQ06176.1 cobaltochelatase subunit CobN [Sneathiella chinensis]